MRSKTKFGVIAGAVALALSANVFANTSTGTAGTIWLSIDDTTAQSEYVFDTGISVTSFTGASSDTGISLTGTAFTSFLATVTGGNLSTTADNVTFSVIGGGQAGSPVTRYVDYTSTGAPTGNGTNGSTTTGNIQSAYGQIGTFLNTLLNPSGGSSFQDKTATGSQWVLGNTAANFDSNMQGSTNAGSITSALAFYQQTETGTGNATTFGTETTFAGTWSLDLTNSTLNYKVASVPLPAPLLLLLSGLGAMGIVGRRKGVAA